MSKIEFGDYNYIDPDLPAEGQVNILMSPVDLMSYWSRCGLISDFVANYYSYISEPARLGKNIASTIINELVENAAKFSVLKKAQVELNIKFFNSLLYANISNVVDEGTYSSFKKSLEELFSAEDLDDFYIKKLESKSSGTEESGIGLLMMLKDYPMKLGVMLDKNEEDNNYKVETQVYIFMEDSDE